MEAKPRRTSSMLKHDADLVTMDSTTPVEPKALRMSSSITKLTKRTTTSTRPDAEAYESPKKCEDRKEHHKIEDSHVGSKMKSHSMIETPKKEFTNVRSTSGNEGDWITPKEARSLVRTEYTSNKLTLAQRLRLEHLISRGSEKLAKEVMEVHSERGHASEGASSEDDTSRKLEYMREKYRKGEINKEEYMSLKRTIIASARAVSGKDDSEKVKRLRARMKSVEETEQRVREMLCDLAALRAKDDVRKVRQRTERAQTHIRVRVDNLSSHSQSVGHSSRSSSKVKESPREVVSKHVPWLTRRRSLSESDSSAQFMEAPSGERDLLVKFEGICEQIAEESWKLGGSLSANRPKDIPVDR